MIRLRITPDGRIHGLWTDEVDFIGLGQVRVRRASYVEFDHRRQEWCVREAVPRQRWRRLLQFVLRRPMGRMLHGAASRSAALAWEQDYFQAGGEGLTFDKAM